MLENVYVARLLGTSIAYEAAGSGSHTDHRRIAIENSRLSRIDA